MNQFIDSFFRKNKTSFFTFLIFGCLCGAVFRYDLEWWDFINYHYYNAWAFLNDRLNVDVVPAFINTFFSPFIELPAYFLTNALNDHPVIFSAIMAIPYGLLLFASYKIATLFFSPDTKEGRIRIALTLLLCVFSTIVFMEVSAITHEHPVSFLVLAALYPLLKGMKEHHLNIKSLLFSGFVLGAAAGLKMTYALYAAATGVALIFFYKQFDNPLKTILYFTLAGTIGFLASYGYWGWILWKNFQSPVFPFFNNIFQSPYWTDVDYKDVRYFGKSWLTVLFYPFYIVFKTGGDYSLHHRFLISHLRLIAGVFVFIITFISVAKKRFVHSNDNDLLLHFLMFWMVVAYLFWLWLFRVYRYMIPFELMLSVVLVHFFFKKEKISPVSLALFLLFICLTGRECIHLPGSRTLDNTLLPKIENVSLEKNTLILIDVVPSSLMIPFLSKDKTMPAAIAPTHIEDVNGSLFYAVGYFSKKRHKLISEYQKNKNPIVLLTDHPKDKKCVHLLTLFQDDFYIPYFLCPYVD
ncbi:MAG: hypothetical protein IKR09_09530 [Alphaproteobacteria bacterium]|nr:hypothetical protein [Alphaproteobacteria bacterium]